MKRIATALIVLACFAGSAIAATQMTVASKLQRFANPELCFLEVAATEHDGVLVRDELNRRNVQCTSQLRNEGKAALEQTVRLSQAQLNKASQNRANAKREINDRQESQRLMRCASTGGQAEPGCRNGY